MADATHGTHTASDQLATLSPPHRAEESLDMTGSHNLVAGAEDPDADTRPSDRTTATVTSAASDGLHVQLSDGRMGFVAKSEFGGRAAQANIGDQLDVWVIDWEEKRPGHTIHVSESKAEALQLFERLRAAVGSPTVISGEVVAEVKGGLSVDIGLRAFLPANKIELKPVTDLRSYVGKRLDLHLVDFQRKQGGFILSRRGFAEQELQAKRAARLQALAVGDVIPGIVHNLVAYGAFVDLGEVTALLHVKDMGWGRIARPDQMVHEGQEIRVKVLSIDHAAGKVTVGLKQVLGDPWSTLTERYKVGQKVQGRVVSLSNYGAFVELEPGIEGLVHVSEMSWTQRINHPSDVVAQDAMVDVVILDIDAQQHRMSLGIKQTQPSPWDVFVATYPIGSTVEGSIVRVTPQGISVELAPGVSGYCKASQLYAEELPDTERKALTVGQTLAARIMEMDKHRHRVSLSVRALTAGDDDYRAYMKEHADETGDLTSSMAHALAPLKEKLFEQGS